MESIICLDASPLIDYYRKRLKAKIFFYKLTNTYAGFVLPVTAHFEILLGSNSQQHLLWKNLFEDMLSVPYQAYINFTVINISKQLKLKRKTIEYKDLMMAATALHFKYNLATINEKHFKDIDGLNLITPSSFIE